MGASHLALIFLMFQRVCLFYCPAGPRSGMKMGMHRGRPIDSHLSIKQLGFTLFEIILVLAIVSVLTAVIISRNGPVAARAKLRGEVELLKSQLRYAQARALNANQVWGLTANANQVWLFNDGNTSNRVKLPGESGDLVDYASDPRKAGLSVAGVPSPFIVSFDDRGRPYTDAAATSLAATPVVMTVTDGTTTIPIDITPHTGFIQ
jgi:prepilin-type N-terminal cleavage/methylation domain-containing protein